MYFIDESRRLFELHGTSSYYAMCVDDTDRLRFVSWGPRPANYSGQIHNKLEPQLPLTQVPHQHASNFSEVPGYGEESIGESALSVLFSERSYDPKFEQANVPVRAIDLHYVSYRFGQPTFSYAGKPTHSRSTNETRGDWFIITLSDRYYPFEVDLCLRILDQSDVIERYTIINNKGDQNLVIRHAWACSMQLPPGRYQATTVSGSWASEFNRQCHKLPNGSTLYESRSIATGLNAQPWIYLQPMELANRFHGETYGAQLAWSGHWRIHIETRHDRTIRVHLGENPVDSQFVLPPNTTFATPLVLVARSDEGEEGLRREYHRYHHAFNLIDSEKIKPVLYNSWEATYFDLSTENQIRIAEKAAKIGVELFVVDDGWFGSRRHERAGLGDWYVSNEIFPDGLGPLIDAVHQLGMRFGIWFEPEMVNSDSDLYREHPDWVLHFPAMARHEARHQLVLDFGNPEVVEHIRACMCKFLDHHEVDFIKWDMNRAPSHPGSIAGEQIWHKHVEAVHGLIDGLLTRYPNLSIQSCSSGGGRADAAMLSRCCQVWASDNTDALDRVRIQDGYVQAYPASTMECWVTHETNHQTNRKLPLSLRFASAMRGVLGIGSSLDELDEDQLNEYSHWINFYKKIRYIIQCGVLHRLAFPELHDGLSVWQFVTSDRSESYLNAIMTNHRMCSHRPRCLCSGLSPQAEYSVSDPSGQLLFTANGAELMSYGLELRDTNDLLDWKAGACWHFHLVRLS